MKLHSNCTFTFVAGAKFGEVALLLFVAGAVCEVWNDSRSAKCCIFQYQIRVVSAKSNLTCAADFGLTGSFSGHGRIVPGL